MILTGVIVKTTELVSGNRRPTSYSGNEQDTRSLATGSKLYLIAIAHTHPDDESNQMRGGGSPSVVGGDRAGIANSKEGLDLMIDTGLPDFILDVHKAKTFKSTEKNFGTIPVQLLKPGAENAFDTDEMPNFNPFYKQVSNLITSTLNNYRR